MKPTKQHAVRAITGSGRDAEGRDFYVYGCSCGATWRQIRVDQLAVGEQPEISRDPAILAVTGRKRGNGGKGYLCSRCQMPKKGHVCKAIQRPSVTSPSPHTIVVKVSAVPSWYSIRTSNERTDMHTFIWALEQASIPWSDPQRSRDVNFRSNFQPGRCCAARFSRSPVPQVPCLRWASVLSCSC